MKAEFDVSTSTSAHNIANDVAKASSGGTDQGFCTNQGPASSFPWGEIWRNWLAWMVLVGIAVSQMVWFDCTEEEYIALTAGGTAAEINTETKSEEEIRGATTSVDILDAAGAAKDAKEWAEVQARFSAEANARLKKVAGKSCENLLLFYTKSNEILISVCTRRRSRGKAKSWCACRKIPNGCFRN